MRDQPALNIDLSAEEARSIGLTSTAMVAIEVDEIR